MCFIRVNTKHQPINPPGAAPVLTNVYDRTILDTTVDITNPTANKIVESLNVNEKLRVKSDQKGQPPVPVKRVSVEEVAVRREGKTRESMPKDKKGSRGSRTDSEKVRNGSTAISEKETERQRSLGILEDIKHG